MFLQWDKRNKLEGIRTDVCQGCTSWFNTPQDSQALPTNTSYLELEALCDKPPCELEILGAKRYCETVICAQNRCILHDLHYTVVVSV